MARNNNLPKNVLVARFSALGDVAMTIPVVYSVCRCNPGTRFIFITKSGQTSMFVNPPENLTVLGIDVKQYRTFGDYVRLLKELRRVYAIDAFADLHGVLRTYMLR
ncbi:glycosyltransferase family 9 protein, partial [Muribaculum intestinale]